MSVMRKCVCCDKEYEFCPSCKKKDQPAWMVSFCSEPCKGLFNIISAYNSKRVGKGAVQAYIAEQKITDFTKYTPSIKRALEEVVTVAIAPRVELPKVEPVKVEEHKEVVLPKKAEVVIEKPHEVPIEVKAPIVEPAVVEAPVVAPPIREISHEEVVAPIAPPVSNVEDHQRPRFKRRRRR